MRIVVLICAVSRAAVPSQSGQSRGQGVCVHHLAILAICAPARRGSLGRGNGRVIAFEGGICHSALRFGVLHEGLPDEAGARIFRHNQGDASVNADDVAVIPFFSTD
jgi:hypothetical protein